MWIKKLVMWPFKELTRRPLRKLLQMVPARFTSNVNSTNALTGLDAEVQTNAIDNNEQQGGKSSLENVPFINDTPADDNNDIADTVVGKLSAIMALAQSTTDAVPFEGWQLQGALLASLQMVQDSRRTTAALWDQFYESSGQPLFTSSAKDSDDAPESEAGASSLYSSTLKVNLELENTTEARNELIQRWIDLLHLADWAYLEETSAIRGKLQELNANNTDDYEWSLVRHVQSDEPGRVGHYLALDRKSRTALIAVKGTSALSDMITDACGVPVRFNVTQCDDAIEKRTKTTASSITTVSCHEGILDASLALTDDLQPLVEQLFLPAGYRVLLIGHSLGAGVACMVGQLLRSRFPALRQETKSPSKLSPFPRFSPLLEVVAFAPPPMLDLKSAVTTSDYVTSIVNNDDLIPRASLSNLVSLLRFLKIVDERLAEKGLRLDGPKATVEWLKRVLVNRRRNDDGKKEEGEDDSIMTAQEIFDGINEAGAAEGKDYRAEAVKDMNHLFVPGKVVVVYEKHVQSENATGAVEEVRVDDSVADVELERVRENVPNKLPQSLQDVGSIITDMLSKKESMADKEASSIPIESNAIISDGTALVLRHININSRMLGDHMPDAYEKTFRSLMREDGTRVIT